MALQLMQKKLLTDQIIIDIGFDNATIKRSNDEQYTGQVTKDHYGRLVPKHAHGTFNIPVPTSSAYTIMRGVSELFDSIVQNNMLIRRLNITANHILSENSKPLISEQQLNLFAQEEQSVASPNENETSEKEKRIQQTILDIKNSFGKNAILRGLNFRDGATARERNLQIGGHKA